MLQQITYEQAKRLSELKLLSEASINGELYTHLDDEPWDFLEIQPTDEIFYDPAETFNFIYQDDYLFHNIETVTNLANRILNNLEVTEAERFGIEA